MIVSANQNEIPEAVNHIRETLRKKKQGSDDRGPLTLGALFAGILAGILLKLGVPEGHWYDAGLHKCHG